MSCYFDVFKLMLPACVNHGFAACFFAFERQRAMHCCAGCIWLPHGLVTKKSTRSIV